MVLIGGVAASFESSFGEMNAVYIGSLHLNGVVTPLYRRSYRRCTGVVPAF
jgi:hypothetical protein